MKTMKNLHASVPRKLYLMLSLGMVAFLLLGSLMMARPAQAAVNETCTTNADGDWSRIRSGIAVRSNSQVPAVMTMRSL